QLRNMNQSFNSRFQLHKGAKVHQASHLSLDHRTNVILRSDVIPRTGAELLESETDFAPLPIDFENYHFHALAGFHDRGRIFHARPAYFADMQEAVHAA